MAKDRGEGEAQGEWHRAFADLPDLLGELPPAHYPLCGCEHAQFLAALRGRECFTARGHINERRVMRYLLARAWQNRSRLVSESQRQIALAIEARQATVHTVLARLHTLDWLRSIGPGPYSDTHRYELTLPDAAMTVSTRKEQATAGTKADTSTTARVHRLFGSQGLRGGCLDTFAVLPEHHTRVAGGALVRVTPGTAKSGPLSAPGVRQTLAGMAGAGLTVSGLQQVTGTPARTLRRQLQRMSGDGLAFSIEGHWWRYRFDPDWLAAELAIPRTDLLRQRRFALDRASFLQSRAELPEGHPKRLEVVPVDAAALYVHPVTGEIRGEASPWIGHIKSAPDNVQYPMRGDE